MKIVVPEFPEEEQQLAQEQERFGMSKTIITTFFVLVLVVSCSFFIYPAFAPLPNVGVGVFDHYLLVVTWPKSFCQFRTCKVIPEEFVVHGLWPQTAKSREEFVNCGRDEDFDEYNRLRKPFPKKMVREEVPALQYVWKSLTYTDASLWERQWCRHGTCSPFYTEKKPADIVGYFNLGVDRYQALKLTVDKLKANGLAPHKNKQYSFRVVEAAIKTTTGYYPQIHCEPGIRQHRNKVYLNELYFCLTSQGQFEDCPFTDYYCGSKVIFPSEIIHGDDVPVKTENGAAAEGESSNLEGGDIEKTKRFEVSNESENAGNTEMSEANRTQNNFYVKENNVATKDEQSEGNAQTSDTPGSPSANGTSDSVEHNATDSYDSHTLLKDVLLQKISMHTNGTVNWKIVDMMRAINRFL